MSLSIENRDSTDSIPDSLLQTVGIMKHTLRSMRYIEKRLCETMESSGVDPRLRCEMQSLFDATSDVRARLSLMSITVTEVLKEAVVGQSAGRKACDEAKRRQGPERKGRNRLEIVRTAVGRP